MSVIPASALALRYPEPPPLPPELRAIAQGHVRYEDISQDGRVMLLSLAHGVGLTVWQNLLAHHPGIHHTNRAGIIPILTRMVIEGGDGPFSVRRPLDFAGGYQFAHTEDQTGTANRLILNIWVDATGVASRSHGPPPPNAGQRLNAGRVFAEHVFTRLFAPAAERKVLSLAGVPGIEPVPPALYQWRPQEELLALPAGATWLEDAARDDDATIFFGLNHTDSNQHVNSLVYPRLFEDAVLRRLGALGKNTALLARYMDIAYRKPCFAGERFKISLRAFALPDGRLGAAGAYVAAGGGKPHVYLTMLFAP